MRLDSTLNVDLEKLQSNIDCLKSYYPKKNILFMVKADGYGHGIIEVSKAALEVGVTSFGVASLGEGLYLRKNLREYTSDIYVYSDNQLDQSEYCELYLEQKLIPVIYHLDLLKIFLENKDLSKLPLALHFDTGMNRLGIRDDELEETINLCTKFGRKDIYHLTSHFSDSVLKSSSNKNKKQVERFNKVKAEFKSANFKIQNISMANSGALEQKMESEDHNVIRPGILLYGPKSLIHSDYSKIDWENKLISSLETKIIDVKRVKKGDPVGYGSTPCPRTGNLHILPLGYGDGFPTLMMGKKLLINERKATVIGRVNMDMMQVMFDDESTELKRGDSVSLWDKSGNGVDLMCQELGRISYEVFCSLTSRIKRKYCKI